MHPDDLHDGIVRQTRRYGSGHRRRARPLRDPRGKGPAFAIACLVNQKRIEPFLAPFSLEKLHPFGQEGILAPNEPQVLRYPAEEQALWAELAKEVPELLVYSEHAMYIGRKDA